MGGRDVLLGAVMIGVLGDPLPNPRMGGRPYRLGHLHRVVGGVGGRVVGDMGLQWMVQWSGCGRRGWGSRRPPHNHDRRLRSSRVVLRLRGEPRRAYRVGEVGVSSVHERRGESRRTVGPPCLV